jgi:hypothetical protein
MVCDNGADAIVEVIKNDENKIDVLYVSVPRMALDVPICVISVMGPNDFHNPLHCTPLNIKT